MKERDTNLYLRFSELLLLAAVGLKCVTWYTSFPESLLSSVINLGRILPFLSAADPTPPCTCVCQLGYNVITAGAVPRRRSKEEQISREKWSSSKRAGRNQESSNASQTRLVWVANSISHETNFQRFIIAKQPAQQAAANVRCFWTCSRDQFISMFGAIGSSSTTGGSG